MAALGDGGGALQCRWPSVGKHDNNNNHNSKSGIKYNHNRSNSITMTNENNNEQMIIRSNNQMTMSKKDN